MFRNFRVTHLLKSFVSLVLYRLWLAKPCRGRWKVSIFFVDVLDHIISTELRCCSCFEAAAHVPISINFKHFCCESFLDTTHLGVVLGYSGSSLAWIGGTRAALASNLTVLVCNHLIIKRKVLLRRNHIVHDSSMVLKGVHAELLGVVEEAYLLKSGSKFCIPLADK